MGDIGDMSDMGYMGDMCNIQCLPYVFSLTQPSGPGQSSSHDVQCPCMYLYVPTPCNLFQGLSLLYGLRWVKHSSQRLVSISC